MENINIGQNIAALRKKKNVTQDQMASELNITSQAVSKWETNTCQPDTLTLPLIAKYFNVSIDYLFYGNDVTYDDIFAKNFQKVASLGQMNGFEDALKLYAPVHHGLSCGNLRGKEWIYDEPSHISNENGLSLLSGKGYAALVTRRFFENIDSETVTFAISVLQALANNEQLKIVMAIVSMSDISYNELKDCLHFDDSILRPALDYLISAKLIEETVSKHKSLGTTYKIKEMYHTCICIILATLEMQRYSLKGVSCCMGYGDYPISFK